MWGRPALSPFKAVLKLYVIIDTNKYTTLLRYFNVDNNVANVLIYSFEFDNDV